MEVARLNNTAKSPYSSIEQNDDAEQEQDSPSMNRSCLSSEYLKSMTFGGIDGNITSAAIVAAGAGAGQAKEVILIFGLASVCGLAVVLGVSEFFSSKAHREFLDEGRRRATWEFKQNNRQERNKMIEAFTSRGLSKHDSELVVGKIALCEGLFVDLTLSDDLGFKFASDDDEHLLTDSFSMFVSYLFFGCLPVLVLLAGSDVQYLSIASVSSSLLLLVVLGLYKGSASQVSSAQCAIESLSLGVLAAGAAFFIGRLCVNTMSGL